MSVIKFGKESLAIAFIIKTGLISQSAPRALMKNSRKYAIL